MIWKPPAERWATGLATALLACVLSLFSAGARAQSTQIDEVMPGAFLRPEIQFVELRISSCSFPPDWDGKRRLVTFDADGDPVGEFVFPTDPSPVCATFGPASVLIGTQAFADLASTPQPDFVMPPILAPGGGKVCFRNTPGSFSSENLCLTYGGFSGDTEQGSADNAPEVSGAGICALQRDVLLDDFDFTSFNEDFRRAVPAPANSAGETGTVAFPPRFTDVPAASPFFPFVEALARAGITGGCGGGAFCPKAVVSREQMAVFLLLAMEGPSFQPPACAAPVFADVPCSNPFAAWINELAARGVTGGCGGAGMGNYCPGGLVSREQMAVFLLLAMEGPGFTPPACAAPVFSDVPCSSPFARWVNELAARGVTGGCGGGAFCPANTVTREQMAVFLSTAFGLPVPSLGCPPGPPDSDDHGSTAGAATLLHPTVTITGQIHRRGDVDFFAFDALEGQWFLLQSTGLDQPFPTDTALRIFDSDGTTLLANGSNSFGQPRLAGFIAPHAGRFFVSVDASNQTATGTYELTVDGPLSDDHGDTPAEATPLGIGGGPVPGRIEIPQDVDVFRFDAPAGQVFAITLRQPASLWLFPEVTNELGHSFSSTASFDTAAGRVMFFRPPFTGRYFIRLDTFSPRAGAYDLQIQGPVADDHGDTPGRATPLVPDQPRTAQAIFDDVDFFSFNALQGQLFRVDVQATGSCDVAILGVNGSTVVPNRLSVLAPVSGTYFVRVMASSSGSGAGSCAITLRGPLVDDHGNTAAAATPFTVGGAAVGGQLDYQQDVDVFSTDVVAGDLLPLTFTDSLPNPSHSLNLTIRDAQGNFLTTVGSFGEVSHVTARHTGKLFFEVTVGFESGIGGYQLAVGSPVLDDHGNVAALATLLTPGAPAVPAVFERLQDRDYFAFDAVAGMTYRLKASGALFSEEVQLIGTDGVTSLGTLFLLSNEFFTPPADGRYFLLCSPTRSSLIPRSYEIAVGPPVADDHGDVPAAATLLTVGAPPIAGANEVFSDVDVFAFDATAGETLIVETANLGVRGDTFIVVLDRDGTTVLAADDDSGTNLGSRVELAVAETGRYFVEVFQFEAISGSYEISVRSAP